ncbi:hypothetical protein CALVIDRAFT_120477 [Calocera viscosa TUFC12733]|uniref:Uncharacterized protein n=1 Tax=Calocera viscosa (strain TUFC12733) TaxID=1330018 RepID=A0A167MAE5_CALVF|nr:hypothetical protein CALVIDRAFT_120477 [Calocera viscosa TUFC12733]
MWAFYFSSVSAVGEGSKGRWARKEAALRALLSTGRMIRLGCPLRRRAGAATAGVVPVDRAALDERIPCEEVFPAVQSGRSLISAGAPRECRLCVTVRGGGTHTEARPPHNSFLALLAFLAVCECLQVVLPLCPVFPSLFPCLFYFHSSRLSPPGRAAPLSLPAGVIPRAPRRQTVRNRVVHGDRPTPLALSPPRSARLNLPSPSPAQTASHHPRPAAATGHRKQQQHPPAHPVIPPSSPRFF